MPNAGKLVSRLVLVAVLVAVLYVAYQSINGVNFGSNLVRVGECFDLPAGQEFEFVDHLPCVEPHDAEVFMQTAVAGDSNAYPADSVFDAVVARECVPAFETYTGHHVATDQELTLGYFAPARDNWAYYGGRTVTCYIQRFDGAKLTGSVYVLAVESTTP